MLVLSRKRGDAVAVGESAGGEHMVKVVVLDVSAGRVKLGFEAAHEIAVHRWEVWQRIRSEISGDESESVRATKWSDRSADGGGEASSTLLPGPNGGD